MDNEHSHVYSNPHWKADDSYLTVQDYSGSIRIPVRALNITWGNVARFWERIPLTEENTKLTGFEEAALLLQVNWIEVTGKLSILPSMALSTSTTYEILYILKFREDAFGWHSAPVKFKLRINGEDKVKSEILHCYREKQDEWHEIPGGQFTVSKDITVGMVEFGMFEVESDWWKGGLILAGIKIEPKLV
ncbi:Phloem protein 2-like protein [Melia azedarach]|uniref:Phloem protein 2-like protein n=1 Tax=Melia azedarach TaxID=155640 RepID=A0ACC1WTN2_MELAZ|nr:Phloem protein 2-like protein [Melia azedarach]